MYTCDFCRREYSVDKSLKRHVKEKHTEMKYYPCAFVTCGSEFIRRSYLITHLRKLHGTDRATAKRLAYDVHSVPVSPRQITTSSAATSANTPSTPILEDISDTEELFDSILRSPYNPETEKHFG